VILLDTHALLWLTDAGLGKRSKVMADRALAAGELAISAISYWEIALLIAQGRLRAIESVSSLRARNLDDGAI
jgi:PIN domain nuclease of toxin-antitoxin system